MPNEFDVVVLAAGQGKRMHQAFPGVPKVLVPLVGKPMLLHVLDAIEAAHIARQVTIVVGPSVEEKVRTALRGRTVRYALQSEPRGTGHAVLCARPVVAGAQNILVLYGDQPLFSPQTIQTLAQRHAQGEAMITMLTVPLQDFLDWRSSFADFSRVLRDAEGHFTRSVEVKDASASVLRTTEVNPSLYCFRAEWLWEHLPLVGCTNAMGEYYLPDILQIAIEHGEHIDTVPVRDPREALGANTPEQLAVLEHTYSDMQKH